MSDVKLLMMSDVKLLKEMLKRITRKYRYASCNVVSKVFDSC